VDVPDCRSGAQCPSWHWKQARGRSMAKDRGRPNWIDSAGRVMGLLAKTVSLIELIRRLFVR
jgi:hypothetical protein